MVWIIVAILLVSILYWKGIRRMSHWKKLGVQQTNKPAWFLGDTSGAMLHRQCFAEIVKNVYNLYPKARYIGMYHLNAPLLMIRDPELVRQLFVKDFDHFVDRIPFVPADADPLWSKNLFALTGEKWRDMRASLSPAFTSSKMRSMLVFMTECGERFVDHFIKKSSDGKEITVEMKDAFTRYANDVIASAAFGITCDSLKEQDNEFFMMGKQATNFRSLLINVKFVVFAVAPYIAKIFGIGLFSKQVYNFFTRIVKETITVRESQGIVRPDMIHLLLESKKGRLRHEETNANKKDDEFSVVQESDVGKAKVNNHKREITDLDITSQALIFFFAGFETASTHMCFLTYELAVNPDIQEKLYQEIKNNKEKLTYDVLLSMKYLDMVVSEALRKWPPVISVDRRCIKPYTIPSERPHEKPVHLGTNDFLLLPVYAFHHDEKYYPNPEKFDPERFSDENKQNIAPYTYFPFGVGPRNCIGSRFALLETKAAICSLLAKFEITVVDKTPIPMKLTKKQFNMASESGYWVGLKPRN